MQPTFSNFTNAAGISPFNKDGLAIITQEQLQNYTMMVIRACAETQVERSRQRHGYDKYEDGEAILSILK